MCGITGIFDTTDERPVDRDLLARMTAALAARGPDGDGLHTQPGIGFGHRRLSIIDIDGGAQPMTAPETGVTVTYNGEIYNFQALRADLEAKGHAFRTQSDTEVILHGWAEWGLDCVTRFNGFFAFALWDPRDKILFLARDRLGKKPLYYAEVDGGLLFGSELKALMQCPDLPRDIDPQAVEDFFAYGYVPDPKSIYRAVRKLPAGHTLTCKRGGDIQIRQYWDVDLTQDSAPDGLLDRLGETTAARLIADVPLGAFLSGGVDSSAVVAQMASAMEEPVKTFSIGFDHKDYDETPYARAIAEQYGTDHTERVADPNSVDLVAQLAEIYDEPFGDASAMPTYQVCALAREQVTVALSGDGGDEVFAGYRRYLWHLREARLRQKLPRPLRRAVFGTLGTIYPKADWAPRPLRAKTTFQELGLDDVDVFFLSVSVLDDPTRKALFSRDLRAALGGYHGSNVLKGHWTNATDDPLKQVQYADIKTWLPGDILVKVDRASMANSLEVRSPFLDHRFVEWGVNLPTDVKIAGGEKKAVLKKALEPTLPYDVLYRPKQGFSVPIDSWFRGPLRSHIREVLTSGVLADSGFFEARTITRLLNQHQSGRRDHARALWLLLMFQRFLERDGTNPQIAA